MKYQKIQTFFSCSVFLMVAGLLLGAHAAQAATLSLSPASGPFTVGQTITVSVLLDTKNVPIDGVDIRYLNYNPALLSVQDDDASVAGVQITPGTLMPQTLANSVDTVNGKITFSQVVNTGTTYTNASGQTLATIHFTVLAPGTGTATFNFTSGNTTDTNVGSSGTDVLTSVANGSYTAASTFDFSLSSGGSKTVIQGQSVISTVTVTLLSGTTQAVSYSASGLPANATATFGPTSCSPACTTTMTLQTQATTPPGNSTVIVTGTAGALTHTSTFSFTVAAANIAPTVNAGPDQTITLPATALLSGMASDDGLPSGILATTWSKVSGPGTVTFGNVSVLSTTATFSLAGTYTLRLTGNDNLLSASNDIIITVNPVPDTTPPVLSNGLPTGTFPTGTTQATLSVTTNENATCKYSLTANTGYGSMINTFSTTGALSHSSTVLGLISGNTQTYYVRCQDTAGNADSVDFVISFNIAGASLDFTFSAATGTPSVIRGNSVSTVMTLTLVGGTPGLATLSVSALPVGTTATFTPNVCTPTCTSTLLLATSPTSPEGSFLLTVSAVGSVITRSVPITLKILSVLASGVVLTPVLEANSNLADVVSRTFTIEFLDSVTGSSVAVTTIVPDATGKLILPSNVVNEGTYNVRVSATGFLSRVVSGVVLVPNATLPIPQLLTGDINGDNIVNSLDWSIMNGQWFTASSIADLNKDGTVNSLDFGFLNKNWFMVGQ